MPKHKVREFCYQQQPLLVKWPTKQLDNYLANYYVKSSLTPILKSGFCIQKWAETYRVVSKRWVRMCKDRGLILYSWTWQHFGCSLGVT